MPKTKAAPNIRDRIVELRRVRAGDLTANEKNWRTHPKAQQDAMRGVLAEIGYAGASLARVAPDGNLILIDGHLRRDVAPDAVVPVLVTDLDEAEGDYLLATYDPLSAMAGGDDALLAALLAGVRTDDEAVRAMLADLAGNPPLAGATDPDDVPPVPEEPTTRTGDLWLLGEHRLLCGDNEDSAVLARLTDSAEIALTLTDPPYGVNIVAVTGRLGGEGGPSPFRGKKRARLGATDGSKPVTINGNGRGTDGAAHLVAATLYAPVHGDDKPFDPVPLLALGENQIIFGGNYFASKLPDSRCWIVWDKDNTGNFADAELAWTSFDRNVRLYHHTWNGLVRQGSRDVEGIKRLHPTQKPVGMFEAILADFSAEGDIVLDPFLGSGTTLIACERLGRRCYAIEIEPRYVDVAVRRWEQFTGRTAVLG